MLFLRRLALLVSVALGSVLVLAAAPASANDPNGFHLQSPQLYVHENAGQAVITIERTDGKLEPKLLGGRLANSSPRPTAV